MITAASLSARTLKDLEQLARRHQIPGASGMRKDQLIRALSRIMAQKPKAQAAARAKAAAAVKPASPSKAIAASKPVAKVAKGIAKAGVAKGSKTSPARSKSANIKAADLKATALKSASLRSAKPKPEGKSAAGKAPIRSAVALKQDSKPIGDIKPAGKADSRTSRSNRAAKAISAKTVLARQSSLDLLISPPATHPFQPLPAGAARKGDPIKDLSVRLRSIPKTDEMSPGDVAAAQGKAASAAKSSPSRTAVRPEPRDRLVLMVRDSFWLQAEWEISRRNVERARAAMAEHWHTAKPVLRLYEVDDGGANTCEQVIRDIEVHGGVNTWHVDVYDAPRSYRVAIGYLGQNGKFHVLARSNSVSTPEPGSGDSIDENWSEIAENYEKIYSLSGGYAEEGDCGELQELFEERLRRPMGAPLVGRFGEGAQSILNKERNFAFEVDAEMIIYGATRPNARVTIGGEPVKLRRDGTFTVRQSLPDRRQVLPVVASSSDGIEQRTIVLAIERNTKVMEPLIRDGNE